MIFSPQSWISAAGDVATVQLWKWIRILPPSLWDNVRSQQGLGTGEEPAALEKSVVKI